MLLVWFGALVNLNEDLIGNILLLHDCASKSDLVLNFGLDVAQIGRAPGALFLLAHGLVVLFVLGLDVAGLGLLWLLLVAIFAARRRVLDHYRVALDVLLISFSRSFDMVSMLGMLSMLGILLGLLGCDFDVDNRRLLLVRCFEEGSVVLLVHFTVKHHRSLLGLLKRVMERHVGTLLHGILKHIVAFRVDLSCGHLEGVLLLALCLTACSHSLGLLFCGAF